MVRSKIPGQVRREALAYVNTKKFHNALISFCEGGQTGNNFLHFLAKDKNAQEAVNFIFALYPENKRNIPFLTPKGEIVFKSPHPLPVI